eukprot:UN05988
MYPLERGENKVSNNNIFKPFILSLFTNLEKILFYTSSGYGSETYPFLLSSFFSLFWGDILFKHKSLKSMQIKARHKDNGGRSWIYNEYIVMDKELNQTQFKISLNIAKDRKEDTLCIDRL